MLHGWQHRLANTQNVCMRRIISADDQPYLTRVFDALRSRWGVAFDAYKVTSIHRGIIRRMTAYGAESLAQYAADLESHPEELEHLYRDLLIRVSTFFRNPEVFYHIETHILPAIFTQHHQDSSDIRVWVAGCASGEEAYSLALLLHEQAHTFHFRGKITIFATDIHHPSLRQAAAGIYPAEHLHNVSPERLVGYFQERADGTFKVVKELREMIIFAPQNVLRDPPFTRIDLVCCRNLLIYLQPKYQEQVLRSFNVALQPHGFLVLGKSESLGVLQGAFHTLSGSLKIYQKEKSAPVRLQEVPLPMSEPHTPITHVRPLVGVEHQLLHAYDQLLNRYMPAGVLLDEQRHPIHYFGAVTRYMQQMQGRVEHDFVHMVPPPLNIAIRSGIQRASLHGQPVTIHGLRLVKPEGQIYILNLKIERLDAIQHYGVHTIITFEEVSPVPEPAADAEDYTFNQEEAWQQRVEDLEAELHYTREHLQSTIEALQVSNEEIQTTNEELLAANEELIAVNEVLQAVNMELKQTQHEALRNMERLRGAIESSLSAFYLFEGIRDAQGEVNDFVVAEINQIGARRFSLNREQIIGYSLRALIPNAVMVDEMVCTYKQVMMTGQPIIQERVVQRGSQRVSFLQQIVKTGDGVAITSSDITEQKALEEERNTQHLRLELALEGGGLGTWEYNMRTRIIHNDQRAIPLLGLRPDELDMPLDALHALIHPDDRPRLDAALTTYLQEQQERFSVELRIKPRSGAPRWLFCQGRVVERDPDGEIVRMAGTYMDLTERMVVEAQLRASEQRYQTLTTISPVGIYRANRHGFFTYVNPRWCAIVGVSAEAALGMGWLRYIHPEDYMVVRNFWDKTISTAQESQIEFRYLRPDGQICWVIAQVVAEYDPDGTPMGYVGTQIDITRRMIVEERLRHQSALLEEANTNLAKSARMKDQFLANMSHELRTPLTGIIGFSEALSQGLYGDLSTTQHRSVQHIFDNGQHLLKLINDILDLARIGAGQVDLKLGPVLVDEACREVIDLLSTLFHSKRQHFHYAPPDTKLSIEADILRLRQILINLLSNANKFTPEGGELGLEIGYEPWRREVSFSVWDHGIGIAPSQQSMLFQPFVQLDSRLARDQPGTGLGLALVRQLVTLHGGRIEVESHLHHGSRFTVILPQQSPLPMIETKTVASEEPADSVVGQTPKAVHILLAEDDPSVADLLLEYLGYRGYTTSYVAKGDAVIEQIQTLHPHLLLIDIQMPGMSGLDVIARLRADPDPEMARIPIIAITALAMAGDRERCLAAGADDYLSKPVRLETLGATIHRVLTTIQH